MYVGEGRGGAVQRKKLRCSNSMQSQHADLKWSKAVDTPEIQSKICSDILYVLLKSETSLCIVILLSLRSSQLLTSFQNVVFTIYRSYSTIGNSFENFDTIIINNRKELKRRL